MPIFRTIVYGLVLIYLRTNVSILSQRNLCLLRFLCLNTIDFQWLEHRWIVYHGYFELVLESLTKNPIAADIIVFEIISGGFLFYIENGMLCVLIRIASMRRF